MKIFSSTSVKIFCFFVALSVFAASFVLGFGVRAKELGIKFYDIGNATELPVLTGEKNLPSFSGRGIIAIDSDSNTTLFEKNADERLYPASTTKIITALVSLDYYRLDQELTVKDPTIEGQRMGLVRGEKMSVYNLLNGLLIYSANDAAITLADNYPGGRASYVAAMNAKALSLHLTDSHFVNPVGLDDVMQFTTPRDMVRVAKVAMQDPTFAEIVGTKEKIIADNSGKFSYDLKNVNQLLKSVDGVLGVKTGWTEGARENLVTYVSRDGHKVFISLLGSDDRFGETSTLIDWIYKNYSWQKIGIVSKTVGMILR